MKLRFISFGMFMYLNLKLYIFSEKLELSEEEPHKLIQTVADVIIKIDDWRT